MAMKHVAIDVYGLVQGVGFRYTTLTYAQKYDIVGFVSNKSDGSVHIEAQGSAENIMLFIKIIKNGPSKFAQIKQVEIATKDLDQYTKFSIL